MANLLATKLSDLPDGQEIDLGDLDQTLGFLLRMAQIGVYDQFYRHFAGTPVKPGEFTVLRVIANNPGLRQGSLARVLNIKPAHMTKLVHRMVQSGLVQRSVPPMDRRVVELHLTDAGQAFVDQHLGDIDKVHAAERVGLTAAENQQLIALLHKLAFKDRRLCP